jgi:hypothetical protein
MRAANSTLFMASFAVALSFSGVSHARDVCSSYATAQERLDCNVRTTMAAAAFAERKASAPRSAEAAKRSEVDTLLQQENDKVGTKLKAICRGC